MTALTDLLLRLGIARCDHGRIARRIESLSDAALEPYIHGVTAFRAETSGHAADTLAPAA